jgi:hypothetical protein
MGEETARHTMDHLKAHHNIMRQHQINARKIQAEASGVAVQSSFEDIDWGSLFEETDREEEDMYSERANLADDGGGEGGGAGGNEGGSGVQKRNCHTVTEKTANGVSTKTVCSESSSTSSTSAP